MSDFTGVFYIILWISYTQGAEFISPNETIWKNISTICQVALPDINYEASKNVMEIIVDYTGNIKDEDLKDGVWAGYYLSTTPFQYIGCTKIGNRTATYRFDKDIPGLCFSACKKKGVIGISNKKCFCLTSISGLGISAINCTNECKGQPDIACGGKHHMSLYKIELTDFETTSSDQKGNCLRYEINNNKSLLIWRVCDETVQTICTLNNSSIEVISSQGTQRPWKNAMNLCLKNLMHPTTVNHLDHLKGRETLPPSWTGVISSVVIYSNNDPATRQTGTKFGYLEKSGQNIVLKFDNNVSSSRKILCTSDVLESSSDKTTSISSTTSKGTTFSRDSAFTEGQLSPESTSKTKETKDSTFGVPLGISVTVVMIVVAVIVIIVSLQRRGIIQIKCLRKAKTECTPYFSTGIHPSSKNDKQAYEMSLGSPYDQIDDLGLPSERCCNNEGTDNVISGHTYFILEKHTWESNTDENIEKKTKTETINVYNTLNSNGNNTGSNKSGNTYDTTEKVAMKLKAQNHKNVGDDATENTYNNNCSRPVKVGKTDNVYGILNNVEGEYDDVDTRNKKCQFNGGDTYSHIMKKY